MVEIKLTNNLKITRIVVVSEAAVLEFYKQCGEYSSTQYAEFVDEFEDQSVYIGETKLDSPSSEAGIKVNLNFSFHFLSFLLIPIF